jgi:alpha-1,2-mannosyltransferase
VASNIAFGQVNVLLMTLVLVDLLAVPQRARGVLTGIAAMIKLIPLVFVVYILWSRQRRTLTSFLLTCLVCAALPFVVIPGIARDYMGQGLLQSDQPGRTYPVPFTNQSLHAVAMRTLGPAPLPVEALWIVLSAVVVGLLLLALTGLRRSDAALAICYVALAGLLISPVSWSHHWVWMVPLSTAVLCHYRRFPLLVAGVGLTLVVMVGEPWFLQRGADLSPDAPWRDVIWAHGFIVGGLLVLLIAAGYGVRELRLKPATPHEDPTDVLSP